MTDSPSRDCPHCGSRNHASSRFCVGCGGALAAADAVDELQPAVPPEQPGDDTVARVAQWAAGCGHEAQPTAFGFRVRVPVGEERGQDVHLGFGGKDDQGEDLISLLSVCGPVDERTSLVLLKRNGRRVEGHFAIRTFAGEEYFVIVANRRAAENRPEKIGELIAELAHEADLVESQLSAGADVY